MGNDPLSDLQGIHVLVIDDDQLSRHFLRSVLEVSGAIVTAAGTADALRAALIADVLVCDLASAEAAGHDFMTQLQELHVRGTTGTDRPVSRTARCRPSRGWGPAGRGALKNSRMRCRPSRGWGPAGRG